VSAQAEPLAPDRMARRAGIVAALLVLAGGGLTLNQMLAGVFYDDGLYVGAAYALGHGLGYVHPNLPGHPAVVHFPPLYPLLLTPFVGALPLPAAALAAKVLNILLAALAAGLITWHASRAELLGPGVPAWLAAAVVVAAGVAMPMLTILSVLLSEPLFSVLVVVAVILADRPPVRWSADRGALLAGVAAALALLTRSVGVAVGAGSVLYLVLVRGAPWRRTALAGGPVFAAALAWGLWLVRHRGGIDPDMAASYGNYFEPLKQAGLRAFWPSLRDLPRPLGDLTLSWLPGPPGLHYLLGGAALAVLLYGLVLLSRRSSIGLTLLCYFAILSVWPFPVDRFLWVVLPWLGLAWVAAAVRLWQRPTLRPLRVPLAIVAGAVVAGYGRLEVEGLVSKAWRAAPALVSTSAGEMLPWLRTLPSDAVVAADFEPLFWLHTGRTCVPLYVHGYHGREVTLPTAAEQRAYLERQGVTHIVIAGYVSESAPELDALLGAYPGWLSVVHAWGGGRAVFQVNRGH